MSRTLDIIPQLPDETPDAAVARISDSITAKGGDIRTADRWGRRRFAYEINHKHEGYYVVWEALAEA